MATVNVVDNTSSFDFDSGSFGIMSESDDFVKVEKQPEPVVVSKFDKALDKANASIEKSVDKAIAKGIPDSVYDKAFDKLPGDKVKAIDKLSKNIGIAGMALENKSAFKLNLTGADDGCSPSGDSAVNTILSTLLGTGLSDDCDPLTGPITKTLSGLLVDKFIKLSPTELSKLSTIDKQAYKLLEKANLDKLVSDRVMAINGIAPAVSDYVNDVKPLSSIGITDMVDNIDVMRSVKNRTKTYGSSVLAKLKPDDNTPVSKKLQAKKDIDKVIALNDTGILSQEDEIKSLQDPGYNDLAKTQMANNIPSKTTIPEPSMTAML